MGDKGSYSVLNASRFLLLPVFIIALRELSVYTMSTSVLMLTLCFANCVSGQWNLNAGPSSFQGTLTALNSNSGPAFAATSSNIFPPPSGDGFFSSALSNRAGSIDNWNWLNGQNAPGSISFFTSGAGAPGFPPSHSAPFNAITTPYYGSPIGSLSTYQHGTSGSVYAVDDQTILVRGFVYDGLAPDAFFYIGTSESAQPYQGTAVPVALDETRPLGRYEGQDVVLKLKPGMNLKNYRWLAVMSNSQNGNTGLSMDLPNCNVYGNGKLQVRWAVQGFDLLVQMKGRIDDGQYMAFGISGAQNRVSMIGSDVVVAYWDANSNSVIAQDYTINARQECMAPMGVCPDLRVGGSNNVDIVSSSHADGYTSVTYKRRINTGDRLDQVINPTVDTYIVWAIGPLNRDNYPAKHYEGMRASAEVGEKIRFGSGSNPVDNCMTAHDQLSNGQISPTSGGSSNRAKYENAAWKKQYILGSDTKTFIAVIGPSGGRKGFMAATSKPTWGIVWYINGKMAPELILRRGETYHFLVYGGMYPQAQPRFHPFYLTTDPSGGFGSKFPADKQKEEAAGIVAGINKLPNGDYEPVTVGQYCAFVQSGSTDPDAFMSFEEFNRTLRLQCDGSPPGVLPVGDGVAGLLEWTPSPVDPAHLYYQCYSHRDMGWKITLVNDYNEYMPYQDRPQLTEPASGLIAQGYPGVLSRDVNPVSQSNRLFGLSAPLLLVFVAFCLL
ncbi:LOW QUALITY PROTEIN: protein Skeletor, isoforms B/C-like [Paramacrobiotus metropolitanus]|uniref:LOW QUALITY PROTEIN: protein Skeletor, isoforms B/C-like n=1 Tax=Paramacrobiotus metropolitanus TaxID=2943436 RepID=UPI0024465565|nr:LOW QUALITY PROTEIN: protein Skeletor, isoforms B/C-like [Paramacrobiotus metropolitanus]